MAVGFMAAHLNDEFTFEFGTGSYASCSFVQGGNMYIAGGDYYSSGSYSQQLSIVESCRLTRIGQLPYTFSNGACNNFNNGDGTDNALMCFSDFHRNGCLR